jgi:hypothetical protein
MIKINYAKKLKKINKIADDFFPKLDKLKKKKIKIYKVISNKFNP